MPLKEELYNRHIYGDQKLPAWNYFYVGGSYFYRKILGNPLKITSDTGKINKSKVPEYCFPVMKSLLYLMYYA